MEIKKLLKSIQLVHHLRTHSWRFPELCGYMNQINKDITLLENVQTFAFKLCTKQWDLVYEQLLVLLDLPRLSTRRLYLDLLTVYKIIHRLVYYPPNIFTARIGRTPNTARPYLYHCPFTHTNYYKHSFIPHTINTWNTLPLTVVYRHFILII